MEQCGVIVGLDAGNAIVNVKRDTACTKCKACPSSTENEFLIKVPDNANAQPGDKVGITMESSNILKAVAIVYGIPLVGLIAGVLAGMSIGSQVNIDPELSGLTGGIMLTLLTFFGIKLFEPYFRKNACFEPKIVYRFEKYMEGEDKDGN